MMTQTWLKAAILAGVFAAAPAAHAATFTTAQLNDAKSGLQAMRELNTIVFGTLSTTQEIEGKAFVGGNVTGTTLQVGIGNSSSGFTQNTSRTVLTVGGDVSANVKIENNSNGGAGKVISTAGENVIRVGGSVTGEVGMNSASAALPGMVKTGASFNNGNFNPNANKTATYGTTATGVQAQDMPYVTKDATLAVGGANDLKAAIAGEAATLGNNLRTLSDVLSNLATNATLDLSNRNNITFNYSPAASTADFVVVNVAASDLFNGGGTLNLNLLTSNTSGTGYKTTVVNVIGPGSYTYSINNNDNQNSNDANIIWNFNSSVASNSSLAVNTFFHGSILAPNMAISNTTAIEGTVVANAFTQNGEVHLGTFQGVSSIASNVGAVPEPATWLMMIVGFGGVGATMRLRRDSTRKSDKVARI